jgi:NitT/TauT family transport system substrate-binding protein
MNMRKHFAGIVASVLIVAGASQAVHAEPLRLSYFVWPGYGPFFVAQEKGFFAREGVEVELINIEDHGAVVAGLSSGQIHGVLGALQDAATFSQPGEPMVCVLLTDVSRGADGILAANDIQSVPDLKGRSVAVLSGSSQLYYLNVVLKEFGLRQADVEIIDLSAEDAATAFQLQEVDAAVTYEPWLSEGQKAQHGHLLIDTSGGIGEIYAGLVTPVRVLRERESDFEALGRAWDASVIYARAAPEEALDIMRRSLGWDEDPAGFAAMFDGFEWLDGESNRQSFGTADQPGPIYETMREGLEVLSEMGELKMELSPADVIAHGVWD